MFWDCIKVKFWSGRLLRHKPTVDCEIAFFIHLLVCPHFPREESEKRKNFYHRIFLLIKVFYFLSTISDFCSPKEQKITISVVMPMFALVSFGVIPLSSKSIGVRLLFYGLKTGKIENCKLGYAVNQNEKVTIFLF